MRRFVTVGLILVGLGVVGGAVAKDDPFSRAPAGRWNAFSPEDREAFADARLAALRAGLRLRPEQEALWPPVEAAIRDLGRLRREQRAARAERGRMVDDAPAAIRAMADAATARGEALRKLADASAPLYATLDGDQKRRALVLARPMRGEGRGGWHRHRHGPGEER
ncbi:MULTISPECIES: Spy/CpxP family protein refolding chaperone [Methylobacterium]|uniref:Spy/CpxP family protein refolding chaperone n=1 Tax=Methylobacterium TaxID=407 RepID=UPI00104516BF|nr:MULTISPECIES: Spy/CpxP family protein refolding chaperone [Methylobacterium]MDR7040641.1 zinc resistance-associated protein [Methylobacterium sp. BE186]